MPNNQALVDELLDRLASAGDVTAKAMFGGHTVYLDKKPVALVCDDCLFIKPTDAGRELIPDMQEGPPFPGAKLHFKFPPETWDKREQLCELLRVTYHELPAPKRRKKKAAKKKSKKKT